MRMSKKQHSNHEFQDTMLPKNRQEVFKDVLTLHWRTILLMGFMLLVFSTPIQISLYLKDMTLLSIYSEYSNGYISIQEAQTALISYSNLFSLINILFITLIGICLSGLIRIIKRLAWYEPVTFLFDFSKGIMDNGKQYIILFGIVGVLSFASTFISNLSSLTSIDTFYSYLGAIPGLVFSIIFVPIGAYMISVIAIYQNAFRSQIRLGLYLFFSSIISTIKWFLILAIPFAILLVPNFYVGVIGRVILMFVIPFILLKWFLLSSDVLDDKWNSVHYPDLVNKGVIGALKSKKS